MQASRLALAVCLSISLAACGGSKAQPTAGAPTPTPSPTASPSPTPSPSPSGSACSLSSRQDWVKDQIDEWYLFPDLIAGNVNKAAYADLQSYVDALVAPARAQSKDRYFTFVTSIAEENALINSGETAGFGFRLAFYNDGGTLRVYVSESFEGAPAIGQGIGRGDEIIGIGTAGGSMVMISSLPATNSGVASVFDALGPDTPGTTRVLRIRDLGGPEREVTLAKADFNLDPVSPTYGAQVIDQGGTKVGYINLRTFIASTAASQLRSAFQTFKNQGVTRLIVDLRYNGGGLVSIAELFGDLMMANQLGQVFSYTTFRSSKSQFNETRNFAGQSQAISAMKVAFIGTGASASASELLMNAMPPYLGANVALIGDNTYGKPVGQIGLDLTACDDRLRVVAFKTDNADHEGEYFTGLASTFPKTCFAPDDIFHELGDPNEAMVAAALNWLGGGSCTAISEAKTTQAVKRRRILQPERPTAAQHYLPGLF